MVILSTRPVLGRYHYCELRRCSAPGRGKWEFSSSSPAWKKLSAAKQESAGESRVGRSSFAGGGCERGAPLLKFLVCWDAAVCAVSAGGFLYVWRDVRKTGVVRRTFGMAFVKRTTGAPLFGLTPLEFLRVRHWCGGNPITRSGHGSWPLRKGDYEWQSTM